MKIERARSARIHVLAAVLIASCGYAASVYATGDGTRLSVSAVVDSVNCSGSVGVATIHVTVTSVGSTAPATLYVAINGSPSLTSVGTITDWAETGGRTKFAEGTIQIEVPTGTSDVVVIARQPGSNGNLGKQVAAD